VSSNLPPAGRNGNQGPPGGGPPDRGPGSQPPRFRLSGRGLLIALAVFMIIELFYYTNYLHLGQSPVARLKFNTFAAELRSRHIKTTYVSETEVSGSFNGSFKQDKREYKLYSTNLLSESVPQAVSLIQGAHYTHDGQTKPVELTFQPASTPAWENLLSLALTFLPVLFFVGLIIFFMRAARQQSQGIFGFGQNRGKLYTEDRPNTTFADVAGVDPAKAELAEVVDFLKQPAKYHKLGARIPKGVLLVGPPGTGKTLLARAIAGEAHVPFLAISATEFVELFVGVGASRVRDLFTRAKAVAPSIIFIDEIDAIGGSRSGRSPLSGGNDEREQTLNQMLVSMDGFEPNEAVIVLAATNRPDNLDPALLRPGRFDREVVVDPPDRKGREAILRIHSRNIPLSRSVNLGHIAQLTPGMSGADLANLCNEAALSAARKNKSEVTERDFEYALDRVTLGLEGTPLMNEEERRTVAYHEAGHALAAFFLPNVDPVARITITPRGRSLGVTQFLPVDDRRNYRREYLVNRMAVGMGGRSAEEIVFDDITSGAQNDLQMVTNVARTMVTQLGMAPDLGPTYLGGAGDDSLNGRSYNPFEPKEYSDKTASKIDEAINRLVRDAHDRALTVLRGHREALDAVAEALLRDESLDRGEFAALVNAHLAPGEEPFPIPIGLPTPTGEAPVPVKS
jgi:cell division protease FtsH